jgi:hypothetical protein
MQIFFHQKMDSLLMRTLYLLVVEVTHLPRKFKLHAKVLDLNQKWMLHGTKDKGSREPQIDSKQWINSLRMLLLENHISLFL